MGVPPPLLHQVCSHVCCPCSSRVGEGTPWQHLATTQASRAWMNFAASAAHMQSIQDEESPTKNTAWVSLALSCIRKLIGLLCVEFCSCNLCRGPLSHAWPWGRELSLLASAKRMARTEGGTLDLRTKHWPERTRRRMHGHHSSHHRRRSALLKCTWFLRPWPGACDQLSRHGGRAAEHRRFWILPAHVITAQL